MIEKIKKVVLGRKFDRTPKGPMSESDAEIIRVLADNNEPMKASEIHEELGGYDFMTERNLYNRLNSLNDAGYINPLEGGRYELDIEPRHEIYVTEIFVAFLSFLGVYWTESLYPAGIGALLLLDVFVRWRLSPD